MPMNGLHEACYVAPDNATWRIFTQLQPAALVNVSRALPHSHTVFRIIMGAIEPPEDGDWTQGLALAHTLHNGTSCLYERSCPGWANCPFRGGYPKNCWDGLEAYCGYNTVFASCIPVTLPA
jgi:hypothetical protein